MVVSGTKERGKSTIRFKTKARDESRAFLLMSDELSLSLSK